MKRLNDAIFLSSPQTTLLSLGYITLLLAFSFATIDFNHSKDLLLSLLLIGVGGIALYRPRPYYPLPSGIALITLLLVITVPLHLSPLGPGITAHTLRTTLHYTLALLFLLYFLTSIPPEDRRTTIRRLILLSTLPVLLLVWIQCFNLAPKTFPKFHHYPHPIYSIFGNQNLLGGYLAIAVPLIIPNRFTTDRFQNSRYLFLVLLLATCFLSGARSAWLAIALATLCTFPYRRLNYTHFIYSLPIVLILLVLLGLFPYTTLDRITHTFTTADTGLHVRHWIWSAALPLIHDYPLLGIGPGNFQYFSPLYQGHALHAPQGHLLYANEIHTLYAHSTPLDLILELGLAGWVLCFAWIYTLYKHRPCETWGAAISFSVYALFNTTTMSTPHLIAGLLLLTTLSSSTTPIIPAPHKSRYWASAYLLLILPCAFLYYHTTYTPSRQLAQARNLYRIDHPTYADTLEAYQDATAHPWALPQTHGEYGSLLFYIYTIPENAQVSLEKSRESLEKALESLDIGDLHFALSHVYLEQGNRLKAAEHAQAATYRWPRYRPTWEQWKECVPSSQHQALEKQSQEWHRSPHP